MKFSYSRIFTIATVNAFMVFSIFSCTTFHNFQSANVMKINKDEEKPFRITGASISYGEHSLSFREIYVSIQQPIISERLEYLVGISSNLLITGGLKYQFLKGKNNMAVLFEGGLGVPIPLSYFNYMGGVGTRIMILDTFDILKNFQMTLGLGAFYSISFDSFQVWGYSFYLTFDIGNQFAVIPEIGFHQVNSDSNNNYDITLSIGARFDTTASGTGTKE